jgi:hypothetical protein
MTAPALAFFNPPRAIFGSEVPHPASPSGTAMRLYSNRRQSSSRSAFAPLLRLAPLAQLVPPSQIAEPVAYEAHRPSASGLFGPKKNAARSTLIRPLPCCTEPTTLLRFVSLGRMRPSVCLPTPPSSSLPLTSPAPIPGIPALPQPRAMRPTRRRPKREVSAGRRRGSLRSDALPVRLLSARRTPGRDTQVSRPVLFATAAQTRNGGE